MIRELSKIVFFILDCPEKPGYDVPKYSNIAEGRISDLSTIASPTAEAHPPIDLKRIIFAPE